MRKVGDQIIYSATDVVNFLECEHLTSLERINLEGLRRGWRAGGFDSQPSCPLSPLASSTRS